MRALSVNHSWIDEAFYEQGSFIACDQGKSVLLLKGGIFNTNEISGIKNSISIFSKAFYADEFYFHHSDQFLKISVENLRDCIQYTDLELPVVGQGDFDDIFDKDFYRLKKLMPSQIKKAVLVSRENYTTTDPYHLKRHLFAKALQVPKGRVYGFWHRGRGIIGCTPEVLFEMDQDLLVTEALAGTAVPGQESELLNSIKDRNEHDYVIKDISEKLDSVNLIPIIGTTETCRFNNIIHLRTKIIADLDKSLRAIDLGQLLSPTAALGGYPKENSKSFLRNSHYATLFPYRFFGSFIGTEYCGPLGLVMIRNVQWESDVFFIESGVGVVEESELQKEMSELRLKRKVIREHYL